MESNSDLPTQQRPPAKKIGIGKKQHPEGAGNRKATNITKEQRTIAAHLDRIRRLEKRCLELQHENAELRHAHKRAFGILREAH
tara:strand:- start:382 stop:633 length:252 start_codon:yes stop_codon:yes gene_type:complete